MAHRYFTTDISGDTARISGPDAIHLARVLRAEPGMQLILCDGAGTDYAARVLSADTQLVTLEILSRAPSTAEPTIWVDAFIGVAKGERMDFAVQKAVELGASSIRPFFSAHSVVQPKNEQNRAERLGRIATEAAKQSGRGILPQVHLAVDFAKALAQSKQCEAALFFYEAGGLPLQQALAKQKSLALITGPEGGFSAAEAQQAAQAGCITVGLGPRILRCETAPAAAIAAVMALTGNLE